jgi:tetratricopeptide (TPR) repeat protein
MTPASRRRAHPGWSLGAALLWAVLLAAAPRAWALDVAQRIALSRGLVKIEVQRRQGGYSLGTGVIVGAGRVLTNCHVTRDAVGIMVLKYGQRHPAAAQAVDMRHDLCLLKSDGVSAQDALPLGRSQALRDGQRVIALGFTGGLELSVSEGSVVGLHPFEGGAVIQSTNFFNSGASGGALVDDQLRLVGVLTFRLRGGEAHYFSSPVEWLSLHLDGPEKFEPVRPIDARQQPYWALVDEAQPRFLKAQSLLRGGRFAELRLLARQWRGQVSGDAQPAFLQGLAAEALGDAREALEAFEDAVGADRAFASAWLRLGLLAFSMGLHDRARQALAALEPLSPDLASQLASRIGGS